MRHTIRFHPEVKHEAAASSRWYERSRPGLGLRFEGATEQTLDAVADDPLSYGVAHRDIRAAPVSGFPYAVYYRVVRGRVRVLAIYHTARDPSVWQARK